jgi:hypothetical protein
MPASTRRVAVSRRCSGGGRSTWPVRTYKASAFSLAFSVASPAAATHGVKTSDRATFPLLSPSGGTATQPRPAACGAPPRVGKRQRRDIAEVELPSRSTCANQTPTSSSRSRAPGRLRRAGRRSPPHCVPFTAHRHGFRGRDASRCAGGCMGAPPSVSADHGSIAPRGRAAPCGPAAVTRTGF